MATQLLQLRLYKTTVIHALQQHDPLRVQFCSLFLQSVVEGKINPQLPFFSDKAHFHLQGYISVQNNHYWSSQHPHLIHEVPLQPVKVGVWCTVSATRIVGPAFFNKTINCKRYVQVNLAHFFPQLTAEKILYAWIQQDSPTAQTVHIPMQALPRVFEDRIISSIWPARSPDLNLVIFFFWSCFKANVYSNKPQTGKQLKENIPREIENIPAVQLQRVNRNLFLQGNKCLCVQGQHFPHLL
jgi:hypothetical protein